MKKWIPRLLIWGLLICLSVLTVLALVTWRTERHYVCSVCGAEKHLTEHRFGSEKVLEEDDGYYARLDSPDLKITMTVLTEWMFNHGISHKHDWVEITTIGYNVYDIEFSRVHKTAPPIYLIKGSALPLFVKDSDDEEIEKFVNIMENGSEEEKDRKCIDILFRIPKSNLE